MIATSGFLAASEPAAGAYSASPDPLASLRGTTSNRRGREKRERERGGKVERKGRAGNSQFSQIPGSAPVKYRKFINMKQQ